MPTALRVLREIALTLAAIVGAACLIAAIAGLLLGIKPLIFASNSMSPVMPTGTLALARSTPVGELKPGQVVSVVNSGGTRITHRLVSVGQKDGATELTLKGDANEAPDQAPYRVAKADVVFWSHPGLGNVVRALSTPPVAFVAGVIVGGWVVWWLPRRPRSTQPVQEEALPEPA